MEKVLDLRMSGVMELDRDELKEIEGGLGTLGVLGAIGVAIGIAVGWKTLCDGVHEVAKEIGADLAK